MATFKRDIKTQQNEQKEGKKDKHLTAIEQDLALLKKDFRWLEMKVHIEEGWATRRRFFRNALRRGPVGANEIEDDDGDGAARRADCLLDAIMFKHEEEKRGKGF